MFDKQITGRRAAHSLVHLFHDIIVFVCAAVAIHIGFIRRNNVHSLDLICIGEPEIVRYIIGHADVWHEPLQSYMM